MLCLTNYFLLCFVFLFKTPFENWKKNLVVYLTFMSCVIVLKKSYISDGKAAEGGKKQRPEYRRPKAEKRRDARSSLYSIGDVRQSLAHARLLEMESRRQATQHYIDLLRKAFGR